MILFVLWNHCHRYCYTQKHLKVDPNVKYRRQKFKKIRDRLDPVFKKFFESEDKEISISKILNHKLEDIPESYEDILLAYEDEEKELRNRNDLDEVVRNKKEGCPED